MRTARQSAELPFIRDEDASDTGARRAEEVQRADISDVDGRDGNRRQEQAQC